jgi:hypothetical protein
MNINNNSKTSPPLLTKSCFIENCGNPKEGDAKILVDTNGIVRMVIVVKCTTEDSVYFHSNLFKLHFKPGVFSDKPVAVWINMKFRFCNENSLIDPPNNIKFKEK